MLEKLTGIFLIPIIWFFLKELAAVSDRYLPSLAAVFRAFWEISPNIAWHLSYTSARLLIGFSLGIVLGIAIGLGLSISRHFYRLTFPSVQAMRAVPAVAIIPFFLLWFGFSETGKYLIVILGAAINIAVAVYQISTEIPEKYSIAIRGCGRQIKDFPFSFLLPHILERLLPTVRFSLALSVGLVVVSELLGAQIGLGYLIQTSRSTFSLHVIFLAMILFGVINWAVDALIVMCWGRLVYWRKEP